MLIKTQGIVLRPVRYGDTSLVVTVFTNEMGLKAFMVKGVRSSSSGKNKAAYFQPGTILDMVVAETAGRSMHYIREFSASYIYSNIHQDVVRNSIMLFSVEVLLRLLPENAHFPALFSVSRTFLIALDNAPASNVANFPLWFLLQCGRLLGYELNGRFAEDMPYLNREDGGFSSHPPSSAPYTTTEDARLMSEMLMAADTADIASFTAGSESRYRLIDWYIAFLQQYTGHFGNIRSLVILRSLLH